MTLTKTINRFADVLGRYMKAEGLSGPAMADRARVTHATVYAWLNGRSLPPRGRARALGDIMGRKRLAAQIDRERKHFRPKAAAK